jgi:hypothetical protein
VKIRLLAAAALASAAAALLVPDARASAARRWGAEGHQMVGQAAAAALPADMPAFFREAAPQLGWLNPEPDRWRGTRDSTSLDPALDAAHSPDHYVDLELLPAGALAAPDRWAYADSLRAAGVDPSRAGILTHRTLELTERLRVGFKQWRAETDSTKRRWIEQRILNDAGVLGHYVADAANPHHTSIHHNGWVGTNPKGYTGTDSRFHSRFESQFVRTHVQPSDLAGRVTEPPRTLVPLRDSLLAYIHTSHGQLERLYDLDKLEPFGPETKGAAHKAFAVERLTAGARMLRDVWWTAWVRSE